MTDRTRHPPATPGRKGDPFRPAPSFVPPAEPPGTGSPDDEPELDDVPEAGPPSRRASRRRVIVLASALTLLVLMLGALAAVVGVTQTAFGRDWLRRLLVAQLAPKVKGRLYVGTISGGLLTGATIDSLEIRDADDSVFVATGRVKVAWDPRDLADRRILLRSVDVERPVVHIRKHVDGVWNFRRIFPAGPKRVPRPERGFGDYIVIDTATIHGAVLFLTMPWQPADSLRGARRDSAIAYNLARKDAEIRRGPEGLVRTWRWTGGAIASSHVRLADPDSAGRLFVISKLAVRESDPPFRFSNVRGTVRMLGDSLWLALPHWDLPASTGSGTGKVVWGSNLPTRYAIRVVGDSVSLNDVAWVYPTLPREGGGRMVLDIRNQPGDLRVINYALSRMDVRTTGSRLRGNMTYGVGGPVLVVKDVAIEAAPMDFALIRALNGKPFPYPWAGQLTGTVRARGGRLDRFLVDDARFAFHDANVPGAISRGSAKGGLDILEPAFTVFRGLDVTVDQLDLRTLQFLNPNFPRLGGTVTGSATLDSSWLDVRFRNARVAHRDGPGDPTRITGAGRVTLGDEFMTYNLDLQAEALSFTTLARSYPALPLRGSYQGPLRVRGTIEDLDLATTLAGPGGTLAVDGHFDLFPSGYAARGRGAVTNLDLRALLGDPARPPTDLTAQLTMDLAGDSLQNLSGDLEVGIDRSLVDGVRVYEGATRLGFAHGTMRVDTLGLRTAAGTLVASGGVGLARGRSDTLAYTFVVDSLGGLRRWLAPAAPGMPDGAPADSLEGTITVSGIATGSLDSLDAAGTLAGRDFVLGASQARVLTGSYVVSGLSGAPAGRANLDLDTLVAAGVRLTHAAAEARLAADGHTEFAVDAISLNGPRLEMGGDVRRVADTTVVRLDSVALFVGEHDWRLARPVRAASYAAGLVVDTLLLRGSRGGWLTLEGTLPTEAPVRFGVRADSVPLADLGLLVQSPAPLDGLAKLDLTIAGTRARPTMTFGGALADARFGDVRLERVSLGSRYADRRLDATLQVYRNDRSALSANGSLPVDLALAPVASRLLDEPLRANVRSDSVDLAILEAFSPNVQGASGSFEVNVDVAGTWKRPTLAGSITVADGALTVPSVGVRLQRVTADIALSRDSATIRRLSATTVGRKSGSIALTGGIDLASLEDPGFDVRLTAGNFHAINKAKVADLYVSGSLRLAGSASHSRLTGGVLVPAGDIYIPELAGKKVISLDDPEFYKIVDTSLYTNRTLLPDAPPAIVRNLQVDNVRIQMGEDVWLRSAESNINLGGDVGVTVGRDMRDTTNMLFALDGELKAVRGTYRLDLGLALQRTFEVEQGKLTFYGEPDLNPALDISAIHTVRQAGAQDRDVRIRVRIGGTLAQPTLSLSSADETLQLSESDAISYLVTGQPSFVVAGTQYSSQAASVVLGNLSSYFGDKVANALGLDVVQIETAGTGQGSLSGQKFGDALSRTRLGGGVQIGSRTYLRANFGLCEVRQFVGGGSASNTGGLNYNAFINSIGAKVEYRLNGNYSASVGREPPTNLLLCQTQGAAGANFIPTPPQWGLDFTRKWEF